MLIFGDETSGWLDQLLNFAISGTAGLLLSLQVYDHEGAVPGVVGMVGAAVLSILALYYLLIALQFGMAAEEVEESPSGELLRNMLSSAATIVVLGALGHEVVKLDGYNMDSVDMVKPLIVTILVLILRVLDPLFDKGKDKRGWGQSLTIRCADEPDMKPAVYGLSPRSIFIHLLLIGSLVLTAIHHDQAYGGATDDSTKGIYIILYILIGVHALNYALFAALDMVGLKLPFATSGCDDSEVKALSRVPLIRQAVATTALAFLSYLVGALYPAPRVELLIGATVLYSVADSVGRNYL